LALVAVVSLLFGQAAGVVLLNEMEVNPPEAGFDWVELYNTGEGAVDIGGWTVIITDGAWEERIIVPESTIIEGKGFYVARGRPGWHHQDSGFAVLYDTSGRIVDDTPVRTDSLDNDFTWGRYPDGRDTNTTGDWGLMIGTFGRPNRL
jgi:hypothetical protein